MKKLIQQIKSFIESAVKIAEDVLTRKDYNKYFAAGAYLPFIGWLAPMYLKRDDDDCQAHAKNGLTFAVITVGIVFFLTMITIFLPRDWRLVSLLFVILIYLIYLAYFSLCVLGAVFAVREKRLVIPYLDKYTRFIEL